MIAPTSGTIAYVWQCSAPSCTRTFEEIRAFQANSWVYIPPLPDGWSKVEKNNTFAVYCTQHPLETK